MPAKSKLTPEIQRRIVALLRAGNFVDITAQAVGITKETFYQWMKRGARSGASDAPYAAFAEEVTAAQAQAESRAVAVIAKAAEHHWQAAAWYLERRAPARWGRTSAGNVTPDERRGTNSPRTTTIIAPPALTDDALKG